MVLMTPTLMLCAWLCLFATSVSAHQGHHHEAPLAHKEDVVPPSAAQRINDAYLARVKPLFKIKCMNCHSETTVYPGYYKIPGVHQLIDSDIREGREHLDLTHDFPFGGHGKPREDLDAIRDSIKDGSMPPWYYRLLHGEARLSEDERRIILQWVDESKALFEL